MARKQYETKFIAGLKKSILFTYRDNSYWYKIPDDRKFKKPFDIFTSFGNKHFVIEAKVHVKSSAWSLSNIQKHQIEGLQKAARGGYISLVLLQVVYGSGKSRVNFVSLLTLPKIEFFMQNGVKSLKVDLLQKLKCLQRYKLQEINEYVWNVKVMCQ